MGCLTVRQRRHREAEHVVYGLSQPRLLFAHHTHLDGEPMDCISKVVWLCGHIGVRRTATIAGVCMPNRWLCMHAVRGRIRGGGRRAAAPVRWVPQHSHDLAIWVGHGAHWRGRIHVHWVCMRCRWCISIVQASVSRPNRGQGVSGGAPGSECPRDGSLSGVGWREEDMDKDSERV